MKKLIPFLFVIAFISCEQRPEQKFPAGEQIIGLASPVKLGLGTNNIFLADYFSGVSLIDSVFMGEKSLVLSRDKQSASFRVSQDFPPMSVMHVWIGGERFDIPVKRSKKVRHDFIFDPGDKSYGYVAMAGEFNGWVASRNELVYGDGKWTTTLYLDPGTYQYQLVMDGIQGLDPSNPDSIDNNIGGFNSVLKVSTGVEGLPPLLITDEIDSDEIELVHGNSPEKVIAFWQNSQLDSAFVEFDEDEVEVHIPKESTGLERSYIRVWAYNDAGLSNDILVPLEYGNVITDASALDRGDYHANILYNVFVDRFNNGDQSNDRPLNDPEVLPQADYHGGDIKGAIDKIRDGYFTDLGVNAIWISPVVENAEGAYGYWPDPVSKFSAYHGYWPVSFTRVDDHFGSSGDLKDLVDAAHQNGINLFLDFVANHVHELHPVYQANPGWATDLYLPDGSLNTEKWDEYRLTTWFDVFLPTLNLEVPEVTDMLSDSAVWWIKTYGLDGFRHDATKHIPEIFWRTLTSKLKNQVIREEGRPLYQIGETYGGPELISSYVGSGMLDAQFDFNVYDAALTTFAAGNPSFGLLHNRLLQSLDYYGSHNLMGYISGNQDRGRFVSYAGGDLLFSENAKAAGWTRDIGVGDPVGYNHLRMLMAFNMTIPGIPVIYYGDEFGMPGGNDPDNRRMMKFSGLSEEEMQTREVTSYLAKLRRNNMALIYGDFIPVHMEDGIYSYARKYFDEEALVIFNNNDEETTINIELPALMECREMETNFGYGFEVNEGMLILTLPPYSFEILTSI